MSMNVYIQDQVFSLEGGLSDGCRGIESFACDGRGPVGPLIAIRGLGGKPVLTGRGREVLRGCDVIVAPGRLLYTIADCAATIESAEGARRSGLSTGLRTSRASSCTDVLEEGFGVPVSGKAPLGGNHSKELVRSVSFKAGGRKRLTSKKRSHVDLRSGRPIPWGRRSTLG